ncbi:MAG: ABC transporter permease subunit [Planctomycetes bacterium]|nr:ABC transporter permease subunit [Planctomycetota bacterium]
MRETAIVMRRELRSYFVSPIAYVFGVLFLGFLLFIATEVIRDGQQASALPFFAMMPYLFIVFLPALSMRLWAEERKLGTLELLMTFPASVPQLIAGKFLAAMLFLAIIIAMTIGYPITLSIYGNLDWGPVIGAYLASFLMAGAYLSIGMFWSSMTRDQIVAMLLSLVTLAALFFLGLPNFLEWLADLGLWTWLIGVLNGISPFKYFSSIARGVIDTRDIVYYMSFCGFFLYANYLVLQGRRVKG